MAEPTRRCIVCGTVYPLTTEFFYLRKGGYRKICCSCHKDAVRSYVQSAAGFLTKLFSQCKTEAKRAGKEFSLTKEFLREQVIDKPCHYCHDAEERVACERLDNSKGYTPENVVPACTLCNFIRGDRLTHEEMLLLAPVVLAIKARRRKETGD